MRFLHCSDIHLARKPVGGSGEYSKKRYEDYFRAFENLADKAIELKVDAVLIAGDFFDKKELLPESLAKAEAVLQKIKNGGISILLIEGNHDNIGHDSANGGIGSSWLIYLEKKGLVSRPYSEKNEYGFDFHSIVVNDVRIFGIGYQGAFTNECFEAFAQYLDINNFDEKIILMAHTGIASGDLIYGTVESDYVDMLAGKVIYIAGGHLHSHRIYPKEKPFMFLPGSLEYWDMNEFQHKKGTILFDTISEQYEFIEMPKRPAQKLRFNSEAKDNAAFIEEFDNFVSHLTIDKDEELIYMEMKIGDGFYPDIAYCEKALSRAGALKSVIKIDLNRRNSGLSNSIAMSTDEIEMEVIEERWKDMGIKTAASFDLLTDLKKYIQDADNMFEMYDAFLNSHLFDGETNDNK